MRIALAGKGGSGKTTIAGIMARLYAREGLKVLAIDGDSNPNLAISLGLEPQQANDITPLPGGLIRAETDAAGNRTIVLTRPVNDIVADYAVGTPDGVDLLVASRIDHAGTG